MSSPTVGGPPSGEQIHLRHGGQHAVIVEVSGGVRSFDVDGRRLIDGYGEHKMCSGGRGQLLVPWPNRIRDGRYDFDGDTLQLPLSEPDKHNAIHGLLRWRNWGVHERSENAVVMEIALHPRSGFPFALHVAASYRLDDTGLSCTVTARNIGDRRAPYGMGVHPYLCIDGEETVDGCWLEAPGARRLRTDEQSIPVSDAAVAGTEYDFRIARQVGDVVLDTAFTDVTAESDGRTWVRLWSPARDRGVAIWMDATHPYYMLFTGDTLEPARRRRSVAVEPMTCAPNAFASGDGVIVLEPGQSTASSWGITPL